MEPAGDEQRDDGPQPAWGAPRALSLEDRMVFQDVSFALFGAEPTPLTVSRYTLAERIGAGGLGVVYRAHDPELDRDVAVKLVRLDGHSDPSGAQQRLAREARAMAVLEHPNVVSVYDVGEYDFRSAPFADELDDEVAAAGVFIAMALVEGETLSAWLAAPRRWDEIIDVFVEAGRGLAAAHARGLVHRDFKPANVIVQRDRGRPVQVLDFGLSRSASDDSALRPASPRDQSDTLGSSTMVTAHGVVMGTPLYMAPEQAQAAPADARSDQYSFCIALFEALFGGIKGQDRDALLRMKLRGTFPPYRRSAVPAAVHRALLVGLHPEPERRHASMDALLAALQRAKRRRRWRLAVPAVAGIGLLSASAWGQGDAGTRPERACAALRTQWGTVSTAARRDAVVAAVDAATGADAGRPVGEQLSRYAAAWDDAERQACRAEPEDVDLAVVACLGDAARGLDVALGVLAAADKDVALAASSIVDRLPAPGSCQSGSAATVLVPHKRTVAAQVEAIRGRLARARVLELAGRGEAAAAITTVALRRAEALRFAPLTAEALHRHGAALDTLGRYADSRRFFERAANLAEAVRHDHVAGLACNAMVLALGARSDDYDAAHSWARRARAAIERQGNPPAQVGFLHNALGNVYKNQGRFEEGLAEHRAAVVAFEAAFGPTAQATTAARGNIGNQLMHLGRFAESVEVHRQVLAEREAILAPLHPAIAMAHHDLSVPLVNLHRFEEAEPHVRRALAIYEAALRPTHPDLALAHEGLANLAYQRSDFEGALAEYETVLEIRQQELGVDDEITCSTVGNIAAALSELSRLDSAKAAYAKATECYEEHDPSHPALALVLANYASLYILTKDWPGAMSRLQRATVIAEQHIPAGHPFYAQLSFNLGTVVQEQGDKAGALVHYRRVRDVVEAAGLPPEHRLAVALRERMLQFDEPL